MLVAIIMLVFKPYDYGASLQKFTKIGNVDGADDTSADTKWRSVKIRPGLISCERVAKMEGQIFLSKEAPRLPLDNCTENDCRCHYIFLDDRRSGSDRRLEFDRLGDFLPTYPSERRQLPGRRLADLTA
jgi:hypothetical protein